MEQLPNLADLNHYGADGEIAGVPLESLLADQVYKWAQDNREKLVAIRRHIHAHPELSWSEFGTTKFVADTLRDAGLNPVIVEPGNGLYCDIPASNDSAGDAHAEEAETVHLGRIALRGDMDALPLQDTKEVSYRSTNEGMCHGCGHDAHTTVALGAGLALAAVGHLRRPVRLIFQPSEEHTPSGAKHLIEAGVLENVSEIYGFHCDPTLTVGKIGMRTGGITSAADMITVTLRGPGGHTARPFLSADPLFAAAQIVTNLPGILSRRADPRSGLSIVFGALNAGSAANALPFKAELKAMVRTLDIDMWENAEKLVTHIIHDIVAPLGVEVEISYRRFSPPVMNEAQSTLRMTRAVEQTLGMEAVADTTQSLAGDDFAWYAQQIPGSFARLGTKKVDADDHSGGEIQLHQPNFDIDEEALVHGVRIFAQLAYMA